MSMAAVRFGGVAERLGGLMSRAQALRLRSLAEEAYQPNQYVHGLTSEEAERRIDALRAEIALADSF
ncbi:DUF3072 domain-containing protein [Bradyrhizobium sp. ma5]|uniref:DUF3072 domain-containing protein n=1 Tax=unclassified Bradyrhizobium TaxID=2631580 RepID=UPI001CC41F63|nr:DUF3072 domain-containing protein [Bradyrhizobium sp. RD5-C2]GIQ77772.1 hypothetical protein BraRD5C2_62220 [Bradyrhizobium sp. RD5-C2]